MSVELHRPPKPEESQKNQKFSTDKTIPCPGFEPRTSGLAVGSLNHCTIGSVILNILISIKYHLKLLFSGTYKYNVFLIKFETS
jgi:hypothetical protein